VGADASRRTGDPDVRRLLDRRRPAGGSDRGQPVDRLRARARPRRTQRHDLRGEDDDERTFELETRATTLTAVVLIVALAGLFLVTAARGESPLVYGLLLLLAEVTHLVALATLNRRS
jgi:hypothetical protein